MTQPKVRAICALIKVEAQPWLDPSRCTAGDGILRGTHGTEGRDAAKTRPLVSARAQGSRINVEGDMESQCRSLQDFAEVRERLAGSLAVIAGVFAKLEANDRARG